MRKFNKRGFTLAELLIVVAIIAVLVAVSIPVFTTQLEKSREETDIANLRSAYAIVTTDALTDNYKVTSSATEYNANPNTQYTKAADQVYWAYYNIKSGKLEKSASALDAARGKGTTAVGGQETFDGPTFYDPQLSANQRYLIVYIEDNPSNVADKVYAGFINSSKATSINGKLTSSDFLT